MAVLEMVKPVIEFRNERRVDPCPPKVCQPVHEHYHAWLAAISEGWCPPGALDGEQHLLEPFPVPETGEVLLRCAHGYWFRLVYPNQIEAE